MSKFEVNEEAVRKLAELLSELDLSEIEYEAEGASIRVAKTQQVVASMPAAAQPVAMSPSAPSKADDGVPAGAVTAPMVGTVYSAPEPGAPPFISVGDTVHEGQTLLIIEAMKVMNPLASPRAGKVTRILVSNGDPVEYGEPLVVIE